MLSIGEFARHAGVSVRMLRHYDSLGLLVPERVDPATGYRSYSAAQLSRANRLVALKELGFGLEELRPLLDRSIPVFELRAMLTLRRSQLARQIEADAARLREVEARLRMIESEGTMSEQEFVQKELPALRLAQLTGRAADATQIGTVIGPLFEDLERRLTGAGVPLNAPAVAWYDDGGEDVLMAAAFPTDRPEVVSAGLEVGDLPRAERAYTVLHRGSMDRIQESWQALMAHVEQRGEDPVGPCREVYLETPGDDPDGWVTELQQPVRT